MCGLRVSSNIPGHASVQVLPTSIDEKLDQLNRVVLAWLRADDSFRLVLGSCVIGA